MILGVEVVLDAPGSIPGEEGRKSIIILVPKTGTVNANESARESVKGTMEEGIGLADTIGIMKTRELIGTGEAVVQEGEALEGGSMMMTAGRGEASGARGVGTRAL